MLPFSFSSSNKFHVASNDLRSPPRVASVLGRAVNLGFFSVQSDANLVRGGGEGVREGEGRGEGKRENKGKMS